MLHFGDIIASSTICFRAQVATRLAVAAGGFLLLLPVVRAECLGIQLLAWDAAEGQALGAGAAAGNGFIAFGAVGDSGNGASAGAVYVFRRTGASWVAEQKITAPDGEAGDLFGEALAVDDDTLLVGATGDDDRGDNAGAVYVFRRLNESWSAEIKLVALDGAPGDRFGHSVGVGGDVAVVSAINDDEGATDSGAAFIFMRSGSSWSQTNKLTSTTPSTSARYGHVVAVSGNTVAVSANTAAQVYLYERQSSNWPQVDMLSAINDPNGESGFGTGMALDGDDLAVSAIHENTHRGNVYVFKRTAGIWSFQTKFSSIGGQSLDHFGWSVALMRDHLVVGADFRQRVYVFTRLAGTWRQESFMNADPPLGNDGFGSLVAIGSGFILAGAPQASAMLDGAGIGHVYSVSSCATVVPTVSEAGVVILFASLILVGARVVAHRARCNQLNQQQSAFLH